MAQLSPKIFISYSHDSEHHRVSLLTLANRLCQDGLDCTIDQYVNGFPPEGWQRWMETQVEHADFVLVVCTPLYLKRYRGLDENGGRGVTFEGVVISQTLYDSYYQNTKFVPVLPDNGDLEHVPLPLKGFGAFWAGSDYEGLYRYLTGQAAVVKPDVGEPVILEAGASPPKIPPVNVRNAHRDKSTSQSEKKTMSDIVKAAWIVGALLLVGSIITGLFITWSKLGNTPAPTTPQITIIRGNSNVFTTGNGNQVTNDTRGITEGEK